MKQAVKALLLDLDGTLIDTAPDMVAALNRQLQSHHRNLVTYETARKFISHGAAALIKLGFGISVEEPGYQDLHEEYLAEYEKNITEHSQLFNGMEEVLKHCEQNNLFWGVVTNKPVGLTAALLSGLNLDQRSAVTIGGDSLPQTKPHPMPILHACMLLKIAPSECLYVGDAARDIECGKRAGTRTATAEWGYIAPKDDPSQWEATYRVTLPIGILDLI